MSASMVEDVPLPDDLQSLSTWHFTPHGFTKFLNIILTLRRITNRKFEKYVWSLVPELQTLYFLVLERMQSQDTVTEEKDSS